jgi:hypothetical protein
MPQLVGSFWRSKHAVPHFVVPVAQLGWHWPIVQTSPVAQLAPQPPQFFESDVVSTHVPPQEVWPVVQDVTSAVAASGVP